MKAHQDAPDSPSPTKKKSSKSSSLNSSFLSDKSQVDHISLDIGSLEFYSDVSRTLNPFIVITNENGWKFKTQVKENVLSSTKQVFNEHCDVPIKSQNDKITFAIHNQGKRNIYRRTMTAKDFRRRKPITQLDFKHEN